MFCFFFFFKQKTAYEFRISDWSSDVCSSDLTGWPAPGEGRIGQLRYGWGLMLQSDDPRFADFDQSPGPVHSRSSGCWITWDRQYGKSGIVAVSNGRIGKSGYVEGYVPRSEERRVGKGVSVRLELGGGR